jgi:DNA invertase Pin-like site-specific DNA recombinase
VGDGSATVNAPQVTRHLKQTERRGNKNPPVQTPRQPTLETKNSRDDMSNIGYARVSTDGQTCEGQIAELKSAGCVRIFTEHASGGDRNRSELAKALKAIQKGDTLIVYRIDRLARSLTHLLDVVEGLERKGASFRSLHDPIDTSSPQGKFTLQMLGSVAEFERALIRERTKVGLLAARDQGRFGGNPGLRSRSPEVLASVQAARDVVRDEAVQSVADRIVPHIKEMRPREPWKDVAMALNVGGIKRPDGGAWDVGTIKRAASRLVKLGVLDPKVLRRASTATKVSNHDVEDGLDLAVHRDVGVDQPQQHANRNQHHDEGDE